jgi:Protein of unknown function (DUF551)
MRPCPVCGYTKEDAQFNMDHYLCKNDGKAPWQNPPRPQGGDYRPHYNKRDADQYIDGLKANYAACLSREKLLLEHLDYFRWFSVEERSPEIGVPCLLWHPSYLMIVYGGIDEEGEWCGNYGGKFAPETLPYNNPTHWHPLPSTPQLPSVHEMTAADDKAELYTFRRALVDTYADDPACSYETFENWLIRKLAAEKMRAAGMEARALVAEERLKTLEARDKERHEALEATARVNAELQRELHPDIRKDRVE